MHKFRGPAVLVAPGRQSRFISTGGFVCFAGAAWVAGLLSIGLSASAAEPDVMAVYASISPDYHRAKTAGGGFQAETYAFGKGGFDPGAIQDSTIDKMSFLDVARAIAPALASRNYVPCDPKDPRHTNLLIMVYWGTTVGTEDSSRSGEYQFAQSMLPPPPPDLGPPPDGASVPTMTRDPTMSGRAQLFAQYNAQKAAADSALQQSLLLAEMGNQRRDRQDVQNAEVLGYFTELQRVSAYAHTPLDQRWRDVIGDVEESRYYVVLLAYDFQTLYQHKQRKLLWETRFSIREHRNDFGQQLAHMAQAAAEYYGQESRGLLRRKLPEGKVTVGPMQVIEDKK